MTTCASSTVFRPRRMPSMRMRPIITDVPWFVCLLDTLASHAKMTQPIQMLFGMWTWVGTENRLLGGSQNPSRERRNFGRGHPLALCKV